MSKSVQSVTDTIKDNIQGYPKIKHADWMNVLDTEVRITLIGQCFCHTSTETHNPCLCRKQKTHKEVTHKQRHRSKRKRHRSIHKSHKGILL